MEKKSAGSGGSVARASRSNHWETNHHHPREIFFFVQAIFSLFFIFKAAPTTKTSTRTISHKYIGPFHILLRTKFSLSVVCYLYTVRCWCSIAVRSTATALLVDVNILATAGSFGSDPTLDSSSLFPKMCSRLLNFWWFPFFCSFWVFYRLLVKLVCSIDYSKRLSFLWNGGKRGFSKLNHFFNEVENTLKTTFKSRIYSIVFFKCYYYIPTCQMDLSNRLDRFRQLRCLCGNRRWRKCSRPIPT